MNRPYPHSPGCICVNCGALRESQAHVIGSVVLEKDTTPRWFRALREPTFTGVTTYKGINVDKLIEAAGAIVKYNGDTGTCSCDGCRLINELREALPK